MVKDIWKNVSSLGKSTFIFPSPSCNKCINKSNVKKQFGKGSTLRTECYISIFFSFPSLKWNIMTSFVQQLIKYVHSYVAWYCILDIVCFRLVMSFYGTWQRRFRALGLCGENTLDKELLPGCFMYVQVFLLCFAFFWMVSFYTFTLDNAMCFVIDE